MLIKIEHRAVMKFLAKQGKTQELTHEEIVAVYDDSTHSLFAIQNRSTKVRRRVKALKTTLVPADRLTS